MTLEEKQTLERLNSYGNLSREDALELHRLLNLEYSESQAVSTETVVTQQEVVPAQPEEVKPAETVTPEVEAEVVETAQV